LKKEAVSGSKLGSDYLYTELDAEAKIFYCFHIPEFLILKIGESPDQIGKIDSYAGVHSGKCPFRQV